MKNITKYLAQYAEQHIIECGHDLVSDLSKPLETTPCFDSNKSSDYSTTFEHVVVIPAYKESTDFIDRLIASELAEQAALFIIVINQPDSDINLLPQQALADYIKQSGTSIFKDDFIELITTDKSSCFLVVDGFNQPIPEEQGVGLARKLGSDLALYLISKNLIKTDWIHSTDADAHLPDDYFNVTVSLNKTKRAKSVSAVCYNFNHTSDDLEIDEANKLYETALRYYMAGLTFADSPYNFFTIGSVIAFKANDYAMVRGFPKRSAGEDFYLLNKLAKLGNIEFLQDTIVTIDARTSDRVPFGTGPSVANIMRLKQENKPYCYYHPMVFKELKLCLTHFELLWEYKADFSQWLKGLSKESQTALLEAKLDSFVAKQQKANNKQFDKQLVVWFDAFKTLKFIHSLREQKYADIPLQQAMELADFSVSSQ